MKDEKCENCMFYMQHYIKKRGKFDFVYCGHCLKNNRGMKIRKPTDTCVFYKIDYNKKDDCKGYMINDLLIMAKK